jgi:hypothetical protein
MRILLLLAVLAVIHSPVAAQDSLTAVDGYDPAGFTTAKNVISVSLVAAFSAAVLVDSYYTWWQGADKSFSFYSDHWFNGPHLGLDKLGHFYGPYATYKGFRNVLLWGGHDPGAAMWWSAGIAAFHSLQIEIGDGFSEFGFCWEDLAAGWLGVAYGIAQTEIPYLRSFNFKFSYWSNLGARTPANFVSDYDAMTIWLTVNVHRVLPESLRPLWPEFLQLGLGYGTADAQTRREFVIGLDIELESLFSPANNEMLLIQRSLDLMHFPAPAVKFTTGKEPEYYLFHLR